MALSGIWTRPARRLFGTEVNALRNSVESTLNNTELCRKYITDLINKVAVNTGGTLVSTDMLSFLDVVFKSRGDQPGYGGIWGFTIPSNSLSQNNWEWRDGTGFAAIGLSVSNYIQRDISNMSAEQIAMDRHRSLVQFVTSPHGGMSAIHELMHVAVRGLVGTHAAGTDRDFAYAAAALAGVERPGGDENFSNYWGERLNQACGFSSHITKQFTNYRLYK